MYEWIWSSGSQGRNTRPMKSQPRAAIENGLTAQLMKSVTPMPRQYALTPDKRAGIDLDQHRDDHQPDQESDRKIDLRHLRCRDKLKERRYQLAGRDAGDDAGDNPQCQVALEYIHRRIVIV